MLLHFIERPKVEKQDPLATHITVVSPEAEYTASKNVSTENKIERLVKIDAGDQSVCQSIADAMLDRWGEVQLAVTGKILLTAGLDFTEKVKIVIPDAGIDDYFILQSKEHDIVSFTTRVVAGDILLSEQELLARILSDLDIKARG